jgi:hypothetical protein
MTPHYCPTGWSLYHELANTYMNIETGEEYSAEILNSAEMFEKHAACLDKLDEHFKACPQCSLEDARDGKKRATSVH